MNSKLNKKNSTPKFKNCSHLYAYHCMQLLYTTQHTADLITFPISLQTNIISSDATA